MDGEEGFTLTELIVAVAILGLSGVAIVGMFIVMTSTTFLHKQQANVGVVLRTAAENVSAASYDTTKCDDTSHYQQALFWVPVTLTAGSTSMSVTGSPSPFNAGAVGDRVSDSGGSGSAAIPAGTTVTAVSADGSTVTLSATATATKAAAAGDAVMFYPTVATAPTVTAVTTLDGKAPNCSSTPQPLVMVTVQERSTTQHVTQQLSVVKGPAQ